MKQPRAFCEIPAGLASVSLHLQGGKHCKPPVSRMGAKTNYAHAVLDAMGLRPGQGAESYLWTEADPDVRNLLIAYTQPALLRAVAEVLRGWKDEEPRALWTRLRDARKARKAALPLDQSVAEWMFLHHGSFNSGANIETIGRPEGMPAGRYASFGGERPSLDIVRDAAERLATGPGWPPVAVTSSAPSVEEVAGWLTLCAWTRGNRTIGSYMGPDRPSACHLPGWTACITGEGIAKRADALAAQHERPDSAGPWPPTCITSRAPTAEEVAGWVVSHGWGNGATPGVSCGHSGGYRGPGSDDAVRSVTLTGLIGRFNDLAEVSTRPTEPTPGVDLEGCICYLDPPYQGTTGYIADMPRAEVVRLATSYAAAGALVVVSEAVPIPELTALGWEAVDIAGERRGQRRTFSADGGKNEWLTMSKPPVNRPAQQVGMFGP